MANIIASELPRRIEQLLEKRQQHADAILSIDEILGRVGAALGNGWVASLKIKKIATPIVAKAPAIIGGRQRRNRPQFALSAEQSILAFVKERKNPTSAEIFQHAKDEGRSTSAATALGKLVRNKKLKRTPLGMGIPFGKGSRGSRYTQV